MKNDDLSEFISDFVRFYILMILYEGPTHGYEILRKFKARVGRPISPGLVYPFLKKLEDRGLILYTIEHVGEKEKKMYTFTEEGGKLCGQLFRQFAGLVSTAIEPSLDICAHCGCKLYEGGHLELVDGREMVFCCVHCARSYKQDRGLAVDLSRLNYPA